MRAASVRGMASYTKAMSRTEASAVLQLSEASVSTPEIKQRFYELAKETHPDLNKTNPDAAANFIRLSEALEVLLRSKQPHAPSNPAPSARESVQHTESSRSRAEWWYQSVSQVEFRSLLRLTLVYKKSIERFWCCCGFAGV